MKDATHQVICKKDLPIMVEGIPEMKAGVAYPCKFIPSMYDGDPVAIIGTLNGNEHTVAVMRHGDFFAEYFEIQ